MIGAGRAAVNASLALFDSARVSSDAERRGSKGVILEDASE
jgi:hypothetical protein